MRVSWNWLGDHVDLDGLTPEEVAERLTMSGLEVEKVEALGGHLDGVVVGHVVECGSHPNADTLSVCTVDVGADEPLSIVCGAPNVAKGVRAPVATIGTTLPGGLKIKKGKLRGEPSFGMLCSGEELELPDDVDGLMLLDGAPEAGTPIADALGLRDTVLELGITPNRGDALSMRGVAREVAALFGRERREPTSAPIERTGAIDELVTITIADPEGCPRYAAAAVLDVQVGPSPMWMQQRLRAVGQRPVNNLVDVTNYILFEHGQPLHAFDLDHLHGARVDVRRAGAGESIETLDGSTRDLAEGDLLICDADRPIAVAGVMGGSDSEISETTTRVLIECANFDPSTVRRTKQRLKLYTESSYRFERGVDRTAIPEVLERTLDLIVQTQEALGHTCRPVGGLVDVQPLPYVAPVIALPATLPSRVLGIEVSAEQAMDVLRRLGVEATLEGDEIRATIPAFRPDLERPIDLVEEIGRVLGFNELPSHPLTGVIGADTQRRGSAPVEQPGDPVLTTARLATMERLRDACASAGYFEAVNWGMADPARLAAIRGEESYLTLRNPLGVESSVMRTTLLAGLLGNVSTNLARGAERVALFEIGAVFPDVGKPIENDEPLTLAAVACGRAELGWFATDRDVDGHDLTALVARIGEVTGRPLVVRTHAGAAPQWAHPGVSADVCCGEQIVGWVGRLHPDVVDVWEVEVPVFACELSLAKVFGSEPEAMAPEPPPSTPASRRDVALELARSVTYDQIVASLSALEQKFFEGFEVFDVYEGERMAADRKSVAIRLTYRDPDGTLTDKKIEKAHARVVAHLVETLNATQR